MSQGDEFELQRGAAPYPEREHGTEGGQKRKHAYDGMTAAPETLHLLGFWSFEQAQGLRWLLHCPYSDAASVTAI